MLCSWWSRRRFSCMSHAAWLVAWFVDCPAHRSRDNALPPGIVQGSGSRSRNPEHRPAHPLSTCPAHTNLTCQPVSRSICVSVCCVVWCGVLILIFIPFPLKSHKRKLTESMLAKSVGQLADLIDGWILLLMNLHKWNRSQVMAPCCRWANNFSCCKWKLILD